MTENKIEYFSDIYKNPLGKFRVRNREIAVAETSRRLAYFQEINPSLTEKFRAKGVKLGYIAVIGSTVMTAADTNSDLDLQIVPVPGLSDDEYDRLVKTGQEILAEIETIENQPVKLDFWYRKGTESEERPTATFGGKFNPDVGDFQK